MGHKSQFTNERNDSGCNISGSGGGGGGDGADNGVIIIIQSPASERNHI